MPKLFCRWDVRGSSCREAAIQNVPPKHRCTLLGGAKALRVHQTTCVADCRERATAGTTKTSMLLKGAGRFVYVLQSATLTTSGCTLRWLTCQLPKSWPVAAMLSRSLAVQHRVLMHLSKAAVRWRLQLCHLLIALKFPHFLWLTPPCVAFATRNEVIAQQPLP